MESVRGGIGWGWGPDGYLQGLCFLLLGTLRQDPHPLWASVTRAGKEHEDSSSQSYDGSTMTGIWAVAA